MASWQDFYVPPVDFGAAFDEGYLGARKRRLTNAANTKAQSGDYAGAAADYYGMGDTQTGGYFDKRATQGRDEAYGKAVSQDLAAGNYSAAKSKAAEYGRPDDVLTLGKAEKEAITADDVKFLGGIYSRLNAVGRAAPKTPEAQKARDAAWNDTLWQIWQRAELDGDADVHELLKDYIDKPWDPELNAALSQHIAIELKRNGAGDLIKPEKQDWTIIPDGSIGIRSDGTQVENAKDYAPDEPGASGLTPAQTRKTETDLRKEFIGNSKEFIGVRDSFAQIKNLSKNAGVDPAADIAFIFSYMKMLDPGSVVREGEYATAKKTASIPDQLWNAYVNAKNGTTLSPKQVADFTNQARTIYQARLAQHQRDVALYRDFATGYGVNPEVAVPNLALPNEDAAVDADAEPDFIRDPNTGKVVPNRAKKR